jgi:hypothetical protein
MRSVFVAVLIAGCVSSFDLAKAAGFCGAGCHATISGACVVDGWGTVRNECPAGSRPHRPCPPDMRWRRGACLPN